MPNACTQTQMEMKDDYGNYIFESIRITLVCGMQPVCQPPTPPALPPLPFRPSPPLSLPPPTTSLTRAARARRRLP